MIRRVALSLVMLALVATPAFAQDPDPDLAVNAVQPDFTLAALPTTLRVPKGKGAFRVTHRFLQPFNQGGFSHVAENFFGIDAGASVGIEYRFGLMSGTQIGVHRTTDRTIQLFAQHEVVAQGDRSPVDVQVWAGIDGTNNMRDSYSPSLGAVISREVGSRAALYVMPIWIDNTNPLPSALVDDNDTVAVGLGARLRIRPRVYLVLEAMPRVSGYSPDDTHIAIGLERRSGGHAFQLTFANGFSTPLANVARGGTSSDNWYLGFSISRKFW